MVSPYVPFPGIDHAGGAYFEAYLREASRDREVTVFAPWSEANARGQREHGTNARIRLLPVPPDPASAFVRRLWNARNFTRGLTPGWQVLRAFRRDDAFTDALRDADVVEMHWDYLLPVLSQVPPGVPVAAFPYDVVAQTFRRRSAVAPTHFERIASRLLAARIQRQEVALLARAACVFVFSDKDVGLLRAAGLTSPAQVLDPLLETPATAATLDSQTLLFVAAMHRPENVGAVRWFLAEVWPTVQAAVPGARLVVAGSAPPSGLADDHENVEVTGYVDDFGPWYAAARAAVVPLRAGAGLKFKVPQAMLWGLPVVTTPIGAEGIVEHSGPEVFAAVTDDPEAFARACIEVLVDDEHARDLGRRARAWAGLRYDTERSLARCLAVTAGLTRSAGEASVAVEASQQGVTGTGPAEQGDAPA